MATQNYTVVTTHPYEISGWIILFRLIHVQFFDIEVMKGYVYYDLSKLAFNAVEQIKDFHSRIIRIQQYTILLVETVYPTRLLYQYIKALSKSDKLKVFIASKMTYLLTFLDNKNNVYIYKW